MAVITYNELYSLLKDNIVNIVYNKAPSSEGENIGQISLKMTLKRDLVSEGDNSLRNYDIATYVGEWSLSEDSDGALNHIARGAIEQATMTYPNFLKAYSINYGDWININISDIVSTTVVSED